MLRAEQSASESPWRSSPGAPIVAGQEGRPRAHGGGPPLILDRGGQVESSPRPRGVVHRAAASAPKAPWVWFIVRHGRGGRRGVGSAPGEDPGAERTDETCHLQLSQQDQQLSLLGGEFGGQVVELTLSTG